MYRHTTFLITLIFALSAQSLSDFTTETSHVEIPLGLRFDFTISEKQLRLVVDLGHLEAGWYRLNEDGLAHLMKEPNRPAATDGDVPLLSMRVGRGDNPKAKRFGYVATPGHYKFAINLGSRELLVRKYPPETFDASVWNSFGSAINPQDFEGYPNCTFTRNIDVAGSQQAVRYTLDHVEPTEVPLTLQK